MKEGSIGDPSVYLGAKLKPMTLPNGVVAWGMSLGKYVQSSVKNVEEYMANHMGGRTLPKKAPTPFANDYKPEMDTTKELNPENGKLFAYLKNNHNLLLHGSNISKYLLQ
ncbi:hypothetical protein ACA910_011164 [Epithemia clementina (nom. ined.)]